jgi:hypothetical protein
MGKIEIPAPDGLLPMYFALLPFGLLELRDPAPLWKPSHRLPAHRTGFRALITD